MFPRAMGPRSRAVHLIMLVLVVVVLVSLSSAAGAVGVGQPGIGVMRFTATIGGPQSSLPRYGTVFLSSSRTSRSRVYQAVQSVDARPRLQGRDRRLELR